MSRQILFYHDRPVFGLDVGHSNLKVLQVDKKIGKKGDSIKIVSYGTADFEGDSVVDGVVSKPEAIAQSLLDLFKHNLIGDITTNRVAISIPSYRTFSRSIQLPRLRPKQLRDAVELEVEQYIPIPLADLYLDYTPVRTIDATTEYLVVAVPRKIVDSYVTLTRLAGLEVVLIETTMNATARLLSLDGQNDLSTVVIDFGSLSSDISIFDKTVLVTGTVPGGGEVFTNSICDKLKVNRAEAGIIKTKYGMGLSKRQKEITEALDPVLQQIVKEIKRMIRYYNDRYGTAKPIAQIVALGGGANMPGLTDYLTNALRLPSRTSSPWLYMDYHGLQPPSDPDKTMYATVAGLSLVNPKEIFKS
jgi:type IV pilus assembly protein PilM